MRYPLRAGHKLPVGAVSECIAHAAVASGESDTLRYRFTDAVFCLGAQFSHSPDGNNKVVDAQIT